MLKALQTRKKLKDAQEALEAVRAKRAELQTREAELEVAIEEAKPEDEATIDSAIDELEKDKTENDAEEQRLQGIIEELEKEIESEPKPEQATETPTERNRGNKMELREREQAYVKAYADYIRTGKDEQCRAMIEDDMELRALLTENATNGTVPVPSFVYDIVKTAWDRDDLTRRVRKTYLAGDVKVGFEISGDEAVIHEEGETVAEEDLDLGIVKISPETIKKWLSISDEVLDLGEEFLRYVYEEITYKIAKKLADAFLAKVIAKPATSSATAPAVPVLAKNPALDTIFSAVALLSDEATNPVIIAHKSTVATFKGIQAGANYGQDIFDGYDVVENNSLKAYDRASAGDTYMIVGDLENGALFNFPKGLEAVQFKYDDLTLADKDLVRIIGRLPVGYDVIAPAHFVKITKA